MNDLNIKNLIAGFLLLAVAVTSSAIFLLARQDRSRETALVPPSMLQPTPENVFVEDPGLENPAFYQTGQNLLANASPDPLKAAGDNLTDRLIAALGRELGQKNPNGPSLFGMDPGLASPDVESVTAGLLTEEELARMIPDWEREIVFTYKPRLIAGKAAADIAAYQKQRGTLMQKYLGSRPDESSMVMSLKGKYLPITEALTDAQNIPVPEPLAEYHWSLIKLLAYEKRALALPDLGNTDPMRAALVMQAQEQNYFAALALYRAQSFRAAALGLLTPQDTGRDSQMIAWAITMLGIPTARAQLITIDPTMIAQTIWEYVKKMITEFLKDRLVHALVQQTIKWIQGGGKPQFVTNWKGFLTDTAKDAAGKMISKYAPELCQSFGPLVRANLLPVDPAKSLGGAGGGGGPTCTLDKVIGNVRAFADSFESGGWIAYSAVMNPSNNYVGSLIQLGGIAEQEAAKAKEGAKSDTKSSSGFLSQKECVKRADSEYSQCIQLVSDFCEANNYTTDECDDAMTWQCEGLSDEGECQEYRNTTPGEMLAGSIKDSGAAPLLKIVSAQDIAALINALINAALTRLVALGRSFISRGLTGLNPDEPYVAPPPGLPNPQTEPNPVMPEIPGQPTSTSAGGAGAPPPAVCGFDGATCWVNPPGGGCIAATHDGIVSDAVDAVIRNNPGLFNMGIVNDGEGFRDAVVAEVQAGGLIAVKDTGGTGGDEIAVRASEDNYDEFYDLIRDGPPGGYVNKFHVSTCSPPRVAQ